VVPLSQRSGVLEWCTGTVPIGEYLVNSEDGAHRRYRPNDFSANQCQKKMMVSRKVLQSFTLPPDVIKYKIHNLMR
jgi:ataxia telangiectasia mutated family protein